MRTKRFVPALIIAASLGVAGPAAAQQTGNEITNVTGDLYWARNGRHFTTFLVTPEGIILSDPINAEFAAWLKSELASRFGQPVRYVVYTHHHWDHASGGAVFADTAEFVGHEAMPAALAMPNPSTPLPARAAALDANGNGRLERAEASGQYGDNFDLFDADADGALSGAEVVRGPLAAVHPPDVLYSRNGSITLGGKTVEMIHVGPTHAPDMTLLRFPEERAVFLVDFISVKRVPFQTMEGYDPQDLIDCVRFVESLDFDIAVPGHGSIGTKADVTAYREYVQTLRDAVAAGIAAGRTVEQLQRSVTMDEYSDWGSFDQWRGDNVLGMYRILTR